MTTDLVAGKRQESIGFALSIATVAMVGLVGQAFITRPAEPGLPPKSSARVAFAQPVARAPEPFAPRAEQVETPLSPLKAGIRWSSLEAGAAGAVAPFTRAAEAKQAPKPKLAATSTPLPPRRPATLTASAQIAPEGPPVFIDTGEQRAKIGGLELPRLAPVGTTLMRRLGEMRSTVGAVGSSIGRLLRISAL